MAQSVARAFVTALRSGESGFGLSSRYFFSTSAENDGRASYWKGVSCVIFTGGVPISSRTLAIIALLAAVSFGAGDRQVVASGGAGSFLSNVAAGSVSAPVRRDTCSS